MIKILRMGLGYVCIGLGFVGIFLPLLPTTPFFLLALICFSVNPRVREKMLKLPVVREYTLSYIEKKPIPLSGLIRAILSMWILLGISIYSISRSSLSLYWELIPLFIGVAVSIHLVSMYVRRKGLLNETNDEKNRNHI